MLRKQAASPIGPSTRLGAWEVVELLGSGGMCDAYTVRHSVAGGRAVAKVLREELAFREEIAARIEREARLLAVVDHPNVVKLFDAGRYEDRPYLVVEHAGEMDLDDRMKACGGAIGVDEAIHILRSLLSALESIHAKGIVHRDIKPSNVFLREPPRGGVKLIDFGVSLPASEPSITRTGAIYGTPAFMSPEQAMGRLVDHRTDLFAVAATIYTALTGKPPFIAESPLQVIMNVVQSRAEPPRGLKEAVPDGLSRLLLSMLEKEQDRRPGSAGAVLEVIDRLDLPPSEPAGRKRRARGSSAKMAPSKAAIEKAPPPKKAASYAPGPQRSIVPASLDPGPSKADLERPIAARPGSPPAAQPAPSTEPADETLPLPPSRSQAEAPKAKSIAKTPARAAPPPRLASKPEVFEGDAPTLLGADLEGGDLGATRILANAALEPLHEEPPTAAVPAPDASAPAALEARLDAAPKPSARPSAAAPPPPASTRPPSAPAGTAYGSFREDEPAPPARAKGGALGAVRSVLSKWFGKRDEPPLEAPPAPPPAQVVRQVARIEDDAESLDKDTAELDRDALDATPDLALDEAPTPVPELEDAKLDVAFGSSGLFGAIRAGEEIDAFGADEDTSLDARGITAELRPTEPGSEEPNRSSDGDGPVSARAERGSRNRHPDATAPEAPGSAGDEFASGARSEPKASEDGWTSFAGPGPDEMEPSADPFEGDTPFEGSATDLEEPQVVSTDLDGEDLALFDEATPEVDGAEDRVRGLRAAPLRAKREGTAKLERAALPEPPPPLELGAGGTGPPRDTAPSPIAAPGPPEPIEVQLERAGFTNIAWRGQTPEGLMGYDAELGGARIVVHVGRRDPPHYDARARVDALRWLIATRPRAFVPFYREVELGPDYSAFVREASIPERLQDGLTLEPQAAVAVAAVTFRSLSWLHSIGRRFDDFSHNRVRATTALAEFECMLDVPVEYVELDEAIYSTAAGGVIRGDPGYFSPGMVTGRNAQHDAGYRAGALLYSLLSGGPPFAHDHQALIGVFFRRVSEDPPPLSRYVKVDPALARFVDAMVARTPDFRARPPAEVEAEMRAFLEPRWRAALDRALDGVPNAEHVPEVVERIGRARGPTLAPGDRVSLWTVQAHVHFGGEAEIYRVENQTGAPGILKLWYDDRVDPYGARWREFKVGLTGCAAHAAFPSLLDADILVRGVARPYVVLEAVDAPTWKEVVEAGPLSDSLLSIARASELVRAIGVVHENFGVVGDLSSRNVLFAPERGPVLLDVASPGVARSHIAGFGTGGYAAPEVASGEPPTLRSDLFSAGVLIAELVLGRALFPQRIENTLIPVGGFEDPVAAAIADVKATCPEVSRALAGFLAIDPPARPRSIDEALRILDDARARYEVRRAAERRTSSATLTGLERKLPKPIAHLLRSYRIAREPTERTLLGFGLAETLARFAAVIALADYLSSEPRNAKVESELAEMHRRLSFGMWIAVAREACRAVDERGEPFLPELSAVFFGEDAKGRDAMDRLVELRNSVLHRGTKVETVVEEVDREVRAALAAFGFLTGRPLLRAIGQRTRRDGSLELEVEDLHGTSVEPERRTLVVRTPPPSEVVFLADQDFSRRLLLDPFCTVRRCECGAPHVFLLGGVKKDGKIEYVDQASGHRSLSAPEGPSGESTFEAILEARSELYLTGALGADLREAERWWAGDSPVGRGDVLGRYVLEEEIGRGSMGIVFRARHPELGSMRAVKVLKPDLVESDRSLMRRLHQEARIMEQLSTHPGVARVFDYGTTQDESTCYLVMELLEGGSLADRLQRSPPPSLAEVGSTWAQLSDALGYVHGHGVVHRDLKPSNVLFDRDGHPKIADFGVARHLDANRTATIGFEGAPLYAAPEQLAKEGVDHRTDAYALGLLVFDLLRGKPPILDAQRRALQVKRSLSELEAGRVPDDLAHHEPLVELRSALERINLLTAAEPEARSAALGPP